MDGYSAFFEKKCTGKPSSSEASPDHIAVTPKRQNHIKFDVIFLFRGETKEALGILPFRVLGKIEIAKPENPFHFL